MLNGWMDQLSADLSTYLSNTVNYLLYLDFVSVVHLEECN